MASSPASQHGARLDTALMESAATATPHDRIPLHSPSNATTRTGTAAPSMEARTRAWTAGFHQLTQNYLTQLTHLVEETARLTLRSTGQGDGADTAISNGAGTSRLRLRGQGLGGDSTEDAALELDVGDLRRAERELLRELEVRQATRQAESQVRERSPTTQVEASSSPSAPHSSVASKRTSHVTLPGSPTKRGSAHSASLPGQRKRSSHAELAAAPVDEPPIPENVLSLFRHAQHLSPSPLSPSSQASATPATSPHRQEATAPSASDGAKGGDEAEAEALARLCVKYFFTPKPLPTHVVEPPPLPQADRPWSPAERRRSSRQGAAHGHPSEPSQLRHHRGRGEAGVASPGGFDTAFFPPPDLRPHTQKPLRQGSPLQQRQHSFSPESSTPADSSGGGGGLPMSLSGAAAWRKLIDKRTAAAAAAAAPPASNTTGPAALPTIGPSTTGRASPAPVRHGRSDAVLPVRDENFSFGFPPPRALTTATNASEVLEALSKEEKDGPLSRYLGSRLLLSKAAHGTGRATEKVADSTPRLPALHLRQPPPPPPPPPPPSTSAFVAAAPTRPAASSPLLPPPHSTRPVVERQKHKHQQQQQRLPPVTRVGTTRSPASLKPARKGKLAAKSHLAPAVVLPPHYHGLHGEKLTTAELEQLVKSVKVERAEAQASLDSTYEAVDATAEALYALQQSVAQALLENVQLEKDIATLTCAPASVAGLSDEGETEASHSAGSAATATASSSVARVMPPARRALLALPAPVSAAAAAAPFTNSLFSNSSYGPRRGKAQKKVVKGTQQSGAVPSPPATPDRYLDPVAVLEELRGATAAREAEHAETLNEITALSSRIARHDALLHAVAEYWRRNAAVMKRQQFAVQAQPKFPSDPVLTWQSGTANSGPETRGEGGAATCSSSRSSSTSRMRGSSRSGSSVTSINPTDSSAAPSSRVPELSGSPSQLERALAHMEAVSPMLPGSALSFDLHPSQSRTTDNSSVPPTAHLRKRKTVRRRGEEEEEGGGGGMGTSPRQGHHQHAQPRHEQQSRRPTQPQPRSQTDAALSDSSFQSYAASSPTTAAVTPGTTRTLFSSPESGSDEDFDREGREATAARREGVAKDGAAVVSLLPVTPGRVEQGGTASAGASVPHITPPSLMIDAGARRHDARATPAFTTHLTNTVASRREEEEVLQAGSWRIISALQLEKVDEIAEFIYSVFERA